MVLQRSKSPAVQHPSPLRPLTVTPRPGPFQVLSLTVVLRLPLPPSLPQSLPPILAPSLTQLLADFLPPSLVPQFLDPSLHESLAEACRSALLSSLSSSLPVSLSGQVRWQHEGSQQAQTLQTSYAADSIHCQQLLKWHQWNQV
jgi:hypothetical protein